MRSITIYPKNKKQRDLLKSLLKEMRVHFEIEKPDDTLMERAAFYAKIDRSVKQAEEGKVKTLTEEQQKELFDL